MAMSWIWSAMVLCALVFGAAKGTIPQVEAAALQGAASAVELCLSMTGTMCLWSGVMELMNRCGLSEKLAALFHPFLKKLLPHCLIHQ